MLRPLFVFSIFSMFFTHDYHPVPKNLRHPPILIDKEFIFETHNRVPLVEPLFSFPRLVFVSEESPRGFERALRNAKRIDYVTPVRYAVKPIIEDEKMIDVQIAALRITTTATHKFISDIREKNENVKIIPNFRFISFPEAIVTQFVKSEILVTKAAQLIAKFCKDSDYDGAMIESFGELSKVYEKQFIHVHETWQQIGTYLRKFNLYTILNLPAPEQVLRGDPPQEDLSIFSLMSWLSAETADGPKIFKNIFTKETCLTLLNYFDRVYLSTDGPYSMVSYREFLEDDVIMLSMEKFNVSEKLLVGVNFAGIERPLNKWTDTRDLGIAGWKNVNRDRYLEVLNTTNSLLIFNEKCKVHELISKKANVFMIYPSLTQLEYRLRVIQKWAFKKGLGVGITDYGEGLNSFDRLI